MDSQKHNWIHRRGYSWLTHDAALIIWEASDELLLKLHSDCQHANAGVFFFFFFVCFPTLGCFSCSQFEIYIYIEWHSPFKVHGSELFPGRNFPFRLLGAWILFSGGYASLKPSKGRVKRRAVSGLLSTSPLLAPLLSLGMWLVFSTKGQNMITDAPMLKGNIW